MAADPLLNTFSLFENAIAMKIIVHSKTDCPYCKKAKEHLEFSGVEFTEIVHDDYDDRQKMYDELGLFGSQRTVPQIIVDGNRIGGYTELMNSDVVDRYHAGSFDQEF
jgi:glutaredoxin